MDGRIAAVIEEYIETLLVLLSKAHDPKLQIIAIPMQAQGLLAADIGVDAR